MINQNDAQFCAVLVEDFLQIARQFDAVKSDESEMLETALVELRTMPAETMSYLALGVACGVLNSYLKRQSRYQLEREQVEWMEDIRRRIRDGYPEAEQQTIH